MATAFATKQIDTTKQIDLDLIEAGDNDRTTIKPAAVERLAASIAEVGLAQPITVRPIPGGRFQIVAGECRFRAHVLLGLRAIDAHVRDLSDREAETVMLVENVSRSDLTPVQEGKAYAKRLDAGWTVADIETTTGVRAGRIRDLVRCVTHLCDAALIDLDAGILSVEHAKSLCRLDRDRQRSVLEYMREEGFNVKDMRRLIDRIEAQQFADSQSGMFDAAEFSLVLDHYTAEVQEKSWVSRSELLKLLEQAQAFVPAELAAAIEKAL